MDIKLVMFRDSGERREFPVRSVTTVGRKDDCDIRIPVAEVSRHHAEFRQSGGAVQVRDLGSANGTFVNNKRVKQQKLTAGDHVVIGPVVFTVQIDGDPQEIHPVKTFGTHEQKLKFLQPVAGGEVEGCYGLTEAGAGSDAAALSCKAELKGDKYIVNGTKTFITNGNVARYFVLAATTDPSLGYKGVINLIVDLKETPGFKVGKIDKILGHHTYFLT